VGTNKSVYSEFNSDKSDHLALTNKTNRGRRHDCKSLSFKLKDVTHHVSEPQSSIQLFCKTCRVKLNAPGQAKQHFEGRYHARRVKLCRPSDPEKDSAKCKVTNIHREVPQDDVTINTVGKQHGSVLVTNQMTSTRDIVYSNPRHASTSECSPSSCKRVSQVLFSF